VEETIRKAGVIRARVQARIAEIMRAGAERAEVTVEQVVRELKLLGFSDIRKVVSWRNELVTRTEKGKDGEPVMVLMPRVTIVDADKISDEAAAAVAEVSQTVNGALRVKMHDKHAALVSLGRHLGLFTDHLKVDAVYGISEEPMSAEEWNSTSRKADERWRAVRIAELHWHRSHQDAQQAGGPCGPG
jgi:phage terminase small subunit